VATPYWPFVLPALVVVLAVIIFPWAYTVWMSLPNGRSALPPTSSASRIHQAAKRCPLRRVGVAHTCLYRAVGSAAAAAPALAAVVFPAKFPMRGFLRGLFILPMMATPVAIALVWTMMFHPQLGILNYLLSLVGLPPALGVSSRDGFLRWCWWNLAMDTAGDADRARRPRGVIEQAL
jgi:multiple sugar transport system permease protein